MKTKVTAIAAVFLFAIGSVTQFWLFPIGLAAMLLGIMFALAFIVLRQQALLRSLTKHERLIAQAQKTAANAKTETVTYGSSILRRVKLLTDTGDGTSALAIQAHRSAEGQATKPEGDLATRVAAAPAESALQVAKAAKSDTSTTPATRAAPETTLTIRAGVTAVTPVLHADRSIAGREYILAFAFDGAEVTGPENAPPGLSWSKLLKTAFAYAPPVVVPEGQTAVRVTLRTIALPTGTQAVKLSIVPAGRNNKHTSVPFRKVEIKPGNRVSTAVSSSSTVAQSLDFLQEQFHTEPTARTLEQLITHLWNVRGEITRPATLIHQHPDLVRQLNLRATLLTRQISDAANLQVEPPRIPPRSKGAIAAPVRERVLYSVHATPIFHSNGYAVRTRGVAEGLVANGRHVRVVGRPGYPWDVKGTAQRERVRQFEQSGGVEYVHLPAVGLDEVPKGAYIQAAADALVREALEFRPSVIQAASNSQNALIALVAARRLGLPFVYEVRGLWEVTQAATQLGWDGSERYQLDVALESAVLREADAIAVITRQLGDEVVSRGANADRISIVPNSVDVDQLLPLLKDNTYEPVPEVAGVPLIGFAGSLVAYEGLDLLIDAVGKLNAQGTPCHLVIAGSGAHESALKARVRDSQLDNVVHFLGRIPHDDVRRLLASLDVIVCPRTSNRVTEMVSPIKPLEAFAAGRVVLMSDVAPQYDLASGGTIAPLFKADDSDSLSETLRDLIHDPDLRRDYERRARLWVGDNRTWHAVCANLLEAHATAHTAHEDALNEIDRPRAISDLTIAVAGLTGAALRIPQTCGVVELDYDRASWRDALLSNGVDAVVAGDDATREWHQAVFADLFQVAADIGIPTMLVLEGPVGAEHSLSDLAGLVNHVAIVGEPDLDAQTASSLASVTTLSTMGPAVDPTTASPVRNEDIATSVAVLEDSVPSAHLLDIARAHGLSVHTVEGSRVDLPARFVSNRLEHSDMGAAIRAAASAGLVLRDPRNGTSQVRAGIAAYGGVEVVADPGTDLDTFDARLSHLAGDAQERALQGWDALRTSHRVGTVRSVFTLLFRSAGVSVQFRAHPPYAVRIQHGEERAMSQLLCQTVLPMAIVVPENLTVGSDLEELAETKGVSISNSVPDDAEFVGDLTDYGDPEFYEDLLITSSFAPCHDIRIVPFDESSRQLASLEPASNKVGQLALQRRGTAADKSLADTALIFNRPQTSAFPASAEQVTVPSAAQPSNTSDSQVGSVLIAGHDLKFTRGLAAALEADGFEVDRDVWQFHNSHDEERSLAHLSSADTILCEWGLGNAVWYARHKRPNQRLIVRVHSQEIRTPYLKKVDHSAVDRYVFVSELVRAAAITFHGVPEEKTVVVPNAVEVEKLERPKQPGADKNIGFVGTVPQSKRLDLALDVLERVRLTDPEYSLVVKGKGPQDYPWMANRPAEMDWYRRQYDRIDALNNDSPGAVLLEGHGDDMAEWYSRIGVVLSTSDFESFHYTIADGVASGARPAVLYWPGADTVYPRHWLSDSVDETAQSILNSVPSPADSAFIEKHYGLKQVSKDLSAILLSSSNTTSTVDIDEEQRSRNV